MSTEESFSADFNPYQAPQNPFDSDAVMTDVEAIRREYLSHEASVKSIGSLYMLGGILMVIAGGIMIYLFASERTMVEPVAVVVIPILAIIQLMTAVGLRNLRPWARIVAGILSVPGLLNIPVGTLICIYILYLLFGAKGRMVFSQQYRDVIEQTPHVQYKSSFLVRFLLVVLICVLGFAALGLVIGLRR